jgi:hypothetical protein
LWKSKPPNTFEDIDFIDLIGECKHFFPGVKKIIEIFLTLPCTTCTIERSFSTLRRLKTWLRATMGNNRLSGLAMLSIHKERVLRNQTDFVNAVIAKGAYSHASISSGSVRKACSSNRSACVYPRARRKYAERVDTHMRICPRTCLSDICAGHTRMLIGPLSFARTNDEFNYYSHIICI